MLKDDKIFKKAGKACYNVPEGYFDGLRERLEAIPSARGRSISPVQRLKPYLALAACFLAILFVGNVVLRNTAGDDARMYDYNDVAYVDLISSSQFDELLESEEAEQDPISDDDVINYLIDSGMPAELIEYTRLIAKN